MPAVERLLSGASEGSLLLKAPKGRKVQVITKIDHSVNTVSVCKVRNNLERNIHCPFVMEWRPLVINEAVADLRVWQADGNLVLGLRVFVWLRRSDVHWLCNGYWFPLRLWALIETAKHSDIRRCDASRSCRQIQENPA